MELDSIKSTLLEAKSKNAWLSIVGYVNSKGEKKNYEVRHLPADGYKTRLHEALFWLDQVYHTTSKPPEIQGTEKEWEQAVMESTTAWDKAIENFQPGVQAAALLRVGDGAYYVDEKDADAVILLDMENRDDTKPEPVQHRTPVTAYKAWIRSHSPMARYVGKLILKADKVDNLAVLE